MDKQEKSLQLGAGAARLKNGGGRNFIDLLFSSNMIYSYLKKVEPYFYRNMNGRK